MRSSAPWNTAIGTVVAVRPGVLRRSAARTDGTDAGSLRNRATSGSAKPADGAGQAPVAIEARTAAIASRSITASMSAFGAVGADPGSDHRREAAEEGRQRRREQRGRIGHGRQGDDAAHVEVRRVPRGELTREQRRVTALRVAHRDHDVVGVCVLELLRRPRDVEHAPALAVAHQVRVLAGGAEALVVGGGDDHTAVEELAQPRQLVDDVGGA